MRYLQRHPRHIPQQRINVPSINGGSGEDVDCVMLIGVEVDDEGPEHGDEDVGGGHFADGAFPLGPEPETVWFVFGNDWSGY